MMEVTVRHNFETGHRLPHLPGKCQSLHGHSWWAHITVGAKATDDAGLVLDFGLLKKHVRGFIDTYLDHGLMLGCEDPLAPILKPHGKVFVFEHEHGDWPTVENVARLLAIQTAIILRVLGATGVEVLRVRVTETAVNEASWTA